MAALSQPKPKRKDPNYKPEPKLRKVDDATRRMLQERAIKVKQRKQEALEKSKAGQVLAITDGLTQGTNLELAPENPQAEKRRNNIMKSREIRKNSAKGKRPGGGSVFDRLSN